MTESNNPIVYTMTRKSFIDYLLDLILAIKVHNMWKGTYIYNIITIIICIILGKCCTEKLFSILVGSKGIYLYEYCKYCTSTSTVCKYL